MPALSVTERFEILGQGQLAETEVAVARATPALQFKEDMGREAIADGRSGWNAALGVYPLEAKEWGTFIDWVERNRIVREETGTFREAVRTNYRRWLLPARW
jgi:hypothetical protein